MTPFQSLEEVQFPREPNTALFMARFEGMKRLYAQAFAGYPWFENLDDTEVDTHLQAHIQKPGFTAFVATLTSGEIAGGLWYSTPDLDELRSERGEALGRFVVGKVDISATKLVYTHETVVDPDLQGKGVATGLRSAFISNLESRYPDGACVLTRMRDDNAGILAVSEKFGYERTGVKMPSQSNPDVNHEYWYRLINGEI